jgi:DNA polymerase-3 subunit epsilon
LKFVKNQHLVILDVETTGVKAGVDKVIELYMLKIFNDEVVDEYYSKFNPQIEIPLFISNLTGIYPWHVENSPKIDNEIEKIKNFVHDSVIIGHNLRFDLSFLNCELNKKNFNALNNMTLDTLNLSRALLRTKVKNHKLVTLSKYFKTINQNEHNSKADVLTTYEVFKHLSLFDEIKNKESIQRVNEFLSSIDLNLKKKFNLQNIPTSHGVYIFSNNRTLKYVGKSSNLKNRINSHLSHSRSYKSNKIVNTSNSLKVMNLPNELISLIAEQRLINKFKPQLNRSGRIPKNIYWIKLKSNKSNLEISKIELSKNTIFQIGPFLSYTKAKNFKNFLDNRFETVRCKNNNSRKTKCDISILLNSQCACIDSFNLEKYNYNLRKKLDLFFSDTSKEVKRLNDKLNTYSKEQNFEKAQKIKNYLSLLQSFLEFNSFKEKINVFDEQTLKILENFNIEISDNRVNLKIDLSDEDIEFLKIHPENYTIINFYSELLLILRFIRNKEANTIGR